MRIDRSSLIYVIALASFLASGPASGAEQRLGTFYVNPVLAHWMEYQSSNLLDDGSLWGARFGFNLCPWFGIEGFGLRGPTEISPQDDAGVTKVGASYGAWGAAARLMIPAGKVIPFITAGFGRATMKIDNSLNAIDGLPVRVESKESRGLGVFGAGLEVPVHRNVSLRFDAIDHYIKKDFIEGDYLGDRRTHNWELGAGISLMFGKPEKKAVEPVAAPPVQQAPVVVKEEKPAPPPDSDGDGVTDDKDACPGTPQGVKVDSRGCPLDSDKDGVYDYLDQCPDTPLGTKVDAKGCPEVKAEEFKLDVYFDFNQAVVKREYFERLDKLAELLKKSGETVNLIGYTDQKGTSAYNQALSERRAKAVRDYLVSKGVATGKVQIQASGKYPVETDTTVPPAERQRRVIIRLNQ